MGPDQENFDVLRRTLALKRYEAPPPGFFYDLPERVRAGIRAEAARPASPWWQRLHATGWRPALAGVCALGTVCLVVWKAGPGAIRSSPAVVDLAQETAPFTAALSEPAPSVSLFAVQASDEDSVEPKSVHPLLSAPPPSWLFKPGFRTPLPVVGGSVPGLRPAPIGGARPMFLPAALETNAPSP